MQNSIKDKWKPSKINQSIEMVRCDFVNNCVEVRPLKWWEVVVYFRYILKLRRFDQKLHQRAE